MEVRSSDNLEMVWNVGLAVRGFAWHAAVLLKVKIEAYSSLFDWLFKLLIELELRKFLTTCNQLVSTREMAMSREGF